MVSLHWVFLSFRIHVQQDVESAQNIHQQNGHENGSIFFIVFFFQLVIFQTCTSLSADFFLLFLKGSVMDTIGNYLK